MNMNVRQLGNCSLKQAVILYNFKGVLIVWYFL